MRKRTAIIFCAFVMLFSGCTYSNLSVEGLLYAPKLSEEQSVIHQALIDSVGKDIQLKYPRTGDNRSAFVVANIDDEPTDEAIVCYEKKNSSDKESTIRINVLDQFDGKWQSVYELHGMGTEIDKIIISKLGEDKQANVIIGYNMININEKALQIYTYYDKVLKNTYSGSYSIMDVMDIDTDNYKELITITNSPASNNAAAAIFKSVNGEILNTSSIKMFEKIVNYTGSVKGKVGDNFPAIFVDSLKENGIIQTEVFYYRFKNIQNPMFAQYDSLMAKTSRPAGYATCDVDSDGEIEIPVTSFFTGYETAPDQDKMLMTDWYVFDGFNSLKKKNSSYYNINDAYVFMLPSRWQGLVTVKKDNATDEIVFYKYEGAITENMTELMRIRVTDRKNTPELRLEGYSIIKSKGQIDYMVKFGSDDSLVLTMSEISNNLYVL